MDESNKRQRITSSNDNGLHINDLPDGILVGISNYLAKPSVVLFAIAMTTTNSQEQTQTTKAITSAIDWEVLDFNDIEKSLAAKLSDDHIDKILKSIDAISVLKILKLAGCINITGSGLDLLRSSVVIKQIDLSLVGKHEVPLILPEPFLSEYTVLPILDSIISRGRGSSLKQLELPTKWRNIPTTQFGQFLERYDQYVSTQGFVCSKCDGDNFNRVWICREITEKDTYGTQNFTCSLCVNHFCDYDECRDENGDAYSNWCKKCTKEYCKSCSAMTQCNGCDEYFCNGCSDMNECEGDNCEILFCDDCTMGQTCHICNSMKCSDCIYTHECDLDGCDKAICSDCVESKGEGGWCDARTCNKEFCSTECRYLACGEDETNTCFTCLKASASDFRRKLQESKKENEELYQGMDDLYKKYMNVEGDEDN